MSTRSDLAKPTGWPSIAAAMGVAGFLIWLVGYPLLLTAFEAVGGSSGFQLDNVRAFAQSSNEWLALWRSVWISLASVVLAGLVGVPLALVFERAEFPGRRVLGGLIALPVALPPLVGVIAFLFLYGESGFVSRLVMRIFALEQPPWRLHGPAAILLVHAYSMYVYFYLFVRAALQRLDESSLEAAVVLGAGRARIFFRVLLPQLRPALLGASLLAFMTSLGSFSAPYIFAGGYRVMTTQIVASKVSGELGLARVEAIALAMAALSALLVVRWLQGPEVVVSSHGVAPKRRRPKGALGLAAAAWLLSLLVLLPHATLILVSLVPIGTWTTELLPPLLDLGNYRELFSQPERLRPLFNSLWMASVASFGALVLGLLAARRSLRVKGRLGATLEGLIALPWAIPGTVFAIALATTFSISAPMFGRFVWVGTPIILPLAYLVRALPITGRSALAGLRQLEPSLEEAALTLGAGPFRAFFRVVLVAIRPALMAGVGLAFITTLGDFVTSIVLYTYTTRPISIEIQSALRVQEFGVAAAYGVLLMVLSATVFLVWGRQEESG